VEIMLKTTKNLGKGAVTYALFGNVLGNMGAPGNQVMAGYGKGAGMFGALTAASYGKVLIKKLK
jgi:hypothetical protein